MRFISICAAGMTGIMLGVAALHGQATPASAMVAHVGPAAETAELLVFLEPGTDAKQFAAARGLVVKRTLRSDPDAYVMAAGTAIQARTALTSIRAIAAGNEVRSSFLNRRIREELFAFVPNDPYFHKNTPSGTWSGQWHLVNEHTTGLDARVQGAWNRNLTGAGTLIGIADDGLQTTHPDLSPGYVAEHSWDFVGDDALPDPVLDDDNHGTAVAGVAGARGGNGVGVTGAAPMASIAGLRLPFHVMDQDEALFVDAILYHSSGTNDAIKIKNHSYGASVCYTDRSAEANALDMSTALGTIHCWAAGNDRSDANLWARNNLPTIIGISALGSDGRFASYSSYGACVFVAAPSSSYGFHGITTTDRTGHADGYNGFDLFPDADYTATFGGTSSASPLVAGVMALTRQAQPLLNTRFAKHLLVRTCDVVDATDSTPESDGGWRTNAAGFHFNQNYGFGLIDADGLTQLATSYVGVTPLATQTTGTVAVNQTLTDTGSKTVQFTLSATQPLEEVVVTIDFETEMPLAMELDLTSPSGYRTRLAKGLVPGAFEIQNRRTWQFLTNALWGETPTGTWTLKMEDKLADSTQTTWHSYQVTARMGTLTTTACIPAPTNVLATDGTQEDIQINWSVVSGANRYRVYRATSNDFGVSEALTGWQTATSYTDSTSAPLTAYYYWVRASSDSTGQCGSVASSSDVGWSKLRPPTGVAASDGTTTAGVQVTWDAALSATHYCVYRNDVDNPSLAIPVSSWQTGLTYLDSSSAASPGVIRYYWVCSAASSSGQAESGFSSRDTGFRKLSAPVGVQATQGTSADYVRITWSSTFGASHYLVYRNSSDNPATAVPISSWTTSTSHNDTAVDPCTTSYYWVRAAVNSAGSRASDLSTSVSGYRPMPVPTNLSASDGTFTDYCRITWNAVAGATHYKVWQSMTNDPATAQPIGSWQTNTYYNDSNGHRGRIYYYWVAAAKDANGLCASDNSASDSGWQGLLPPNCVNASDGYYIDHVYIGWCYSDYDIYHKVYRGPTSDPAAAVAITGWIDSSYYEDTTGDLGVEYYYFVKAALAADGTGESDLSLGDLGWREIPSPANVAATDGTSISYVRITWDLVGTGLWYRVYRGTSSKPEFSSAISDWLSEATSFDDTEATAGATYYYWVSAATNGSGRDASDSGGPDTGWRALASPTLTASDGTYTDHVAVSWLDAPGTSYYYRVYRALAADSAEALPLSDWQTGASYNDTTGDPGVRYYYWVRAAMNAAGNRVSAFDRSNRGYRALDCNNNGVPDQNDPDADGDLVPDGCDLCAGTVPGASVDANGCPPSIFGDFNRDGDVDPADLDIFISCSGGAAITQIPSGCLYYHFAFADGDDDGDVDSVDFGRFQRCISGTDQPGSTTCDD